MKPEHFCPDLDYDLCWEGNQEQCTCMFHPTYIPPSVYEDCWAGGFELGEDD